MKSIQLRRIFVLLIAEKPILAFEAKNHHEARQLCDESWLRGDLASIESNGLPIWDGKQKIKVRIADSDEIEVFRQADTQQQSDEIVLAYLVELDGA